MTDTDEHGMSTPIPEHTGRASYTATTTKSDVLDAVTYRGGCRHSIYHHGCPSCDRQDPEVSP